MVDSTQLLKKLQVRAGMKLWLLNVPRPFAEAVSAGAEVELVKAGDRCDGAIAFCNNPIEVDSFGAQILAVLPPDGLLWFAYRKGEAAKRSGLSRDVGWGSLNARGYNPVRSIAFDQQWTGLRFRHDSAVKARR